MGETVAKWLMSWGGDMMVLGVKRLKICTFLSEVEIWSDSFWSTVVFFPLQRHWECQGCVWPHEVSVNISFIQCSWAWLSLENEREVQSMFWFEWEAEMNLLLGRANAWNISLEALYGGQFTLSYSVDKTKVSYELSYVCTRNLPQNGSLFCDSLPSLNWNSLRHDACFLS